MENNQATDVEKIVWYVQVWRQADKEAIADRRSVRKQRAEYRARRRLREAVDIATRRAARVSAAGDAGKSLGAGMSRLAGKPAGRKQRRNYRGRRQLHKVVDGATHPAPWLALPAPPRTQCEIPRMPRRRVINS